MSFSPSAKRPRKSSKGAEEVTKEEESRVEESPVVFVHGVRKDVTEADFHDALSQYGPISYVLCLGEKALVEFEMVRSAKECVMDSQLRSVTVAGHTVSIKFSKSEHIRRSGLESQYASNVLVVSVYNVLYPITIDVIYQISSVHGRVMRIAMINKKGVQALVEFDSVAAAKNAKQTMNGADIYSGCCTLKVEFSKVERVNVSYNSDEQWDYTVDKPMMSALVSSLTGSTNNNVVTADAFFNRSLAADPTYAAHATEAVYFSSVVPQKRKLPFASSTLSAPAGATDPNETVVLMVYGVSQENYNCDKIFNLLCSYGDVLKVKFLNSNRDTCMVEMKNDADAKNVVRYLSNCVAFGKTLQFDYSHKKTISLPNHSIAGFSLPDGTPYYKCYNDTRNWRFHCPEVAKKNRLAYPSSKLHFFNVPTTYADSEIATFISKHSGYFPVSFSNVRRVGRSSTGFVEFESTSAALEVLVMCNHIAIEGDSSARPYVFKLAFAAI